MAAFDFPAGPNPGDVFTDPTSGASFTWNGYAWMGGAANSMGALIISPTPPPAPTDNSLWWESDTGMLFLRYNDGNSSQWVQVNALPNGAGYMPLRGVVDGSDAPAGQIGEVISTAIVSPGSTLASVTPLTIATVSLTAGDWDVSAEVWIAVGTGTQTTLGASIHIAQNAHPGASGLGTSRNQISGTFAASTTHILALRTCRASLAATTPYYLNVSAAFATGACTAYGMIWARRAR